MEQEVRSLNLNGLPTYVPDFIKEIIAEITFQARRSSEINQHSGVSCRVSIRSYEAIVGSALRRSLEFSEEKVVPRVTDIESAFPAIAGKMEMEYEAVDSNPAEIIVNLAKHAIKVVFDSRFKLENLSSIIEAFENGVSAEISQYQPSKDYLPAFSVIAGMRDAVGTLVDPSNPAEASAAIEFILEGLHLSNKLNREVIGNRMVYK
jgi:magnesium chelatase subunit I